MSWGSGTFTELMNNPLPGTYININVTSTISRLSGERGYLACPVELNWGTDGDVIVVEASKYETQAMELFGVPAGSPELVYVEEMLKHASVLYLYRINSGTKAVGVLGEAQCTGETGNLITVVVEEDPDNPGDDQPDTTAAIVKGVGQTYTVAYKNLYKQGVAIKVKRAGVVVEQSGNYTVKKTGEDTYTVTMLDTAWPGAYTIEACTGDSDEPLATYGFGLTYPDPTARIERNLNVFTVEYQKLFDKYTASTKLYKGDGTEVDQANNWTISGETDTFTVTILQTIDPGTYRLQAEVDNGTVLAVFTFVIPEPTAKIDVTKENDQYYIEYKDLGGYSADVVIKNEQGDVPKGTKYTVTGQDDVFMVDINDQLEGGTYTLEARVKKSEVSKVLESVTVIIPRPTAEITVTQEGKEYQAVFQNLRAETGALKVKKDGQDVSENVEVTGDNPIVAKIGYDLIDDGDYTVEASSTNEELLDSESFSVPTPTGSIAVNTEGKSYTANFNDLRKKHTGSVKFTKDGEDDSNVQTSGENPIEVTVDYDSLGDGNYKLEAFATGVEAALDSKEFTVKTPTAVISQGTENVKYTILYSDLGDWTATVRIKNDADIEPGTSYTVTDNSPSFTVDIKDELAAGSYTLEARAANSKQNKVCQTQSITIPAPTAEITESEQGVSYSVQYTNLRAQTGSVKLTKDGSDDVTADKVTTEGSNPINVTIKNEELEAGSYKLEAFATGTVEALASKEFTKEAV